MHAAISHIQNAPIGGLEGVSVVYLNVTARSHIRQIEQRSANHAMTVGPPSCLSHRQKKVIRVFNLSMLSLPFRALA